jgi:hypothetical protein
MMSRRDVTRAAAGVGLSVLAVLAGALCRVPVADAAGYQLQPIVITPSSGCGLLTEYTAGSGLSASSGPAPSCGAGPFMLAFNQANTPPPALSRGVATAGSALLAWFSNGVPSGARMGYQITAPLGITINKVVYDDSQLQNIANGRGWIGFTYWDGGTAPVHPNGTAVDAAASGPLNTAYWGIELRCVQSVCEWPGEIQLSSITVYATESQGPSITPIADPASLWDQTGHWIWNAPGNAWPLPVAGADSSGVCTLSLEVGTSAPIADPSLPAPNNSSWQECQSATSWPAAVDTRDYVSGAGQLPLTLTATDAAGPATQTSMSETLNVDNTPVSVSLSTPNDPNPTVWVNHAVTVDATPSAGPSGLGGMSCGVDGTAAQSYPAGGLTVDGDGVRTVSCTAWNNAVDPQGGHNSGTSSVAVHIDEAPPVVSLEPVNPNDPTALVADTSDSESGVAGGSVEIAPAGTGSWTSLPTTFTGSQLLTRFNDAALHGPYTFKVTSCDNVGNCASTTRTVTLPARASAISQISVDQIPASRCPSTPIKHVASASRASSAPQGLSTVQQSGQSVLRLARDDALRSPPGNVRPPVLAGKALATGSAAAVMLARSHHDPRPERAAPASRRGAVAEVGRRCSAPAARLATRARVGYGRPVTLHGLLMSSAGLPLAGQPVAILTAPDNGSNTFTAAAAVTTGPDGSWRATLPPGPSRIIEASYPGSPTILPATGYATVITPAKITLTSVTPDRTPWGSMVRITGRVLGGYIPASSKLLRLDLGVVGIPGLSKIQGIPNVASDGTFTTTYKFARYQGVVRFWLQVSSLTEADFPFSPSHSRRLIVTVGVPAPTTTTTHARHRRARHRQRRSADNRGLARRGEQAGVHRSGRARRR